MMIKQKEKKNDFTFILKINSVFFQFSLMDKKFILLNFYLSGIKYQMTMYLNI